MPSQSKPTLMRLAGRLYGRLGRSVGLTSPPATPRRVRQTEQTGTTTDAAGNTIRLRRTTIEEIEVTPPRPDGAQHRGH